MRDRNCYLACVAVAVIALALLLVMQACIGPFNYDPAPWCTTRAGVHDCNAARAEEDSITRADSTRGDTV